MFRMVSGLCRLSGGERERTDAPFERGDALFEDICRRVHDSGVDVAELLQPEQACRVVGLSKTYDVVW